MIHPLPNSRITAPFNEPRPLIGPKNHNHGAVDYSDRIGVPIHAPEPGELYFYVAFRSDSIDKRGNRPYWEMQIKRIPFPWSNYFYDTYGALIILKGKSGLVHVIAHAYQNQLFNKAVIPCTAWVYQEESADKRWPIHALHTLDHPYQVDPGEVIGYVGNAGYSTGPHAHIEIHNGWKLNPHHLRVDPEQVYKRA